MCARSVLLLLAVNWITESALASTVDSKLSIGKCCEVEEVLVDDRCTPLKETNETKWQPEFTAKRYPGKATPEVKYELKIGRPRCKPNEHQWHVYYYPSGPDRLVIRPNGVLRHYVNLARGKDENGGAYDAAAMNFDDEDEDEDGQNDGYPRIHYDYLFGHYCADKAVLRSDRLVATYAMLCVPDVAVRWTNTDYLMRHAVDPTFHAVTMACYLIVAVIYFVLPQLRDLVGNIITSMMLCLVVNQCASTVMIFTEFGSHVSFMIAGT